MGDAQAAQQVPLCLRSGGGENLCAATLRQLHGRKADAAGGSVHEHAFPPAQPREVMEAVIYRQEGHGDAGGIL